MTEAADTSPADPWAQAVRRLNEVGVEVDADTPDRPVRLTAPTGTELYTVALRTQVSSGTAAAIGQPAGGRLLMVAPYVPEPAAALWRSRDIHYVDSAGNMYLRWPGLLLDVRGRPRANAPRPATPGSPLRAFKASGLKIIFALLVDPDLRSATYRSLAKAAGTSLGTTQWVVKELEDAGYLHSVSGTRRLARPRELFDRWVEAYSLNLAPRLTIARYDAQDPLWWTGADDDLRAADAQWGGETAAYLLNQHLRPAVSVIYAAGTPRALATAYRFRKANGPATVEVRERFWHFASDPPSLTVPTPLIYADLVSSAEPRQVEAAKYLRENDAILRRFDHG